MNDCEPFVCAGTLGKKCRKTHRNPRVHTFGKLRASTSPRQPPLFCTQSPVSGVIEAGATNATGALGAGKHDYVSSPLLAHGGHARRYAATSPGDRYSDEYGQRRWAESSIERVVRSRMELLTALKECEEIVMSDAFLVRKEKATDIPCATSEVREGNGVYDTDPNMIDMHGSGRGNRASPSNSPLQNAFARHTETASTVADFREQGGQEEKKETYAREHKEDGSQEEWHLESTSTRNSKDAKATRGTGRYCEKDGAGIGLEDRLEATTVETPAFGVQTTGMGTAKHYQDTMNQQVKQKTRDEPTSRANRSGGDNARNAWSGLIYGDGGNRGGESAIREREAAGKVQYGNTGIWEHGLGEGK